MRFVQIVFLMSLTMSAFAGKVTWDSNGKPIISESSKPLKGCSEGSGFDTIVKDKNTSASCN